MTADSSGPPALLRVKRKNQLVCAAILAGWAVVQYAVVGSVHWGVLLVQLGWSATFLVLGWLVGAGRIPLRISGVWTGLVSLVAGLVLIHLTGGPDSPYFPMLAALPLTLATFSPDTRLPTVVASGAMLVAVVVLDVMAGMAPGKMLLQLLCFSMLSVVGVLGAQTYQRMREAEKSAQQERLVAQQERLDALEQLAESERRRVRAERERAEVERLVLVGQLAAGVAHEVNNPLAFVKSNLGFIEQELLREGEPLDRAELREVLSETRQGVLRIQQIVADLRRFSREEDRDKAEQGLVEDAVREAKRLASVRLRSLGELSSEVPSGMPPVRLGQRQLVQVLVNLLLNAADAVEMAVPARRAHIVVRVGRVDGAVRLEVEDNGSGIPPEVASRLFEPFFTTKPPGKGTGLGLALCREYVRRAGGTLTGENRSEGGARFVLTLPVVAELASAA
ncbi:sensor histidine kinase [Archangium lansingense]|uniref:sensor histidine kinase n=1 Tax=Archangium lansingense TaxID=2995310 RepID=UPI003B7F987F